MQIENWGGTYDEIVARDIEGTRGGGGESRGSFDKQTMGFRSNDRMLLWSVHKGAGCAWVFFNKLDALTFQFTVNAANRKFSMIGSIVRRRFSPDSVGEGREGEAASLRART